MQLIVLAALLALVALVVVGYPIYQKARESHATARVAAVTATESLEELLAQRDAAFQALRGRRHGRLTHNRLARLNPDLRQRILKRK